MQNSTEKQGLEEYFLNAGFERNIVRDSGKRKILDGIRDLTAPREVVTPKSWHAWDALLGKKTVFGIEMT